MTMRLFVAAFADAETRRRLHERARSLRLPGYRVTALENLHVTLRFLGAMSETDLARLHVLLGAQELAVPELLDGTATGICALPGPGRPRVLAYRLETGGVLEAIAATLNRTLAADFGPPDKPFHAHLTFARLAPRARPIRALPELDGPLPVRFDAFGVYASETRREGPRYRQLFALGEAGSTAPGR